MPRKPNETRDRFFDPFPKRLRDLIERNGIIQDDLTEVLNVKTRQSVTGYTSGETIPTIDKIVALSRYFNVSSDYLLGLSDIPSTCEDVKAVCSYTGLSMRAITQLRDSGQVDILSKLIESAKFMRLLVDIEDIMLENSALDGLIDECKSLITSGLEVRQRIHDLEYLDKDYRLLLFEVKEAFSQILEELFPSQSMLSDSKDLIRNHLTGPSDEELQVIEDELNNTD